MWIDRFRGPLTIQRDTRAIRLAARHRVYAGDVQQYFDYYHGAVEPTHQNGVALVDYSRPAWHTMKPSGDRFYFTALAEPEQTTDAYLAFANLQPGDLVLDCGAYCGGAALAFSRAVGPSGAVVAFEPDPANYAALTENIVHHLARNVVPAKVGLWRSTGAERFTAEGNMGSAVTAVLARRARGRRVPVLSLADAVRLAVRQTGLARVAFVKVDIEGAELATLETAGDVLREHRSRLAIEPHFTPDGPINTEALEGLLTAYGYTSERVYHGVGTHPMLLAAPR